MAKKKSADRKMGGAAGIQTVEGDSGNGVGNGQHAVVRATETNSVDADQADSEGNSSKPSRKAKAKAEPQAANGNFSVADIRKAAAFANSIGGLDKAIGLLQILRVAKDVQ